MIGMVYFCLGLLVGVGILKMKWNPEKMKRTTKTENENRILQLVESSKDIIYYCELKPEIKHTYISPSFETFLGEGLLDQAYSNPNLAFELVHPDDYDILVKKVNGQLDFTQTFVQRWKDSQGNYRWFEEFATPIYENDELIAIHGVIRNIDEKIKLQKKLEFQITHDALTGIFNREFFEQNMDKYNQQVDSSMAILLCDLDDLKVINDQYGHKAGDHLIKEAANLLHNQFSDRAIVSRIGGDEFAILLIGKGEKEMKEFYQELLEELTLYNVKNEAFKISMSVGYAYNQHSLGNMEKLFIEADKNMYKEKKGKKDSLQYI